MSDACDLLIVGDANPDVVLHGAPRELAYGQAEQLVESGALTVGGSAGIMACAAARLGLRTAFASVVGADAAGRFMLEELRRRGVDVGGVRVSMYNAVTVDNVKTLVSFMEEFVRTNGCR